MIDVDDAFGDDLADEPFQVVRRTQTQDDHGRVVVATVTYGEADGCVGMIAPRDETVNRGEDGTSTDESIQIITQFFIQGPSPGKSADLILWGGNTYLVQSVGNYTQFGNGFVDVTAGAVDPTNLPP
jgi:hypothetical protein